MVTKEWVAIHRKHHAKVETPEDPHSPQIVGLNPILWDGVSAYRREAKNPETLKKYGHGVPDDWIERRVYTPHSGKGLILMLIANLMLFGPIGLTVWAVQLMWTPFFAAGVINGIGHFWGYRNFEVTDASRNIVPWGILIAGEELHNNHHTFASSAKLSSKWWEFDIGWMYIRTLELIGMARVKKIPPELTIIPEKQHIDIETAKAVVANRFQVMANFAREVLHHVHREEMKKTKPNDRETWALLKGAKRLLVRETSLLDATSRKWLSGVLARNNTLNTVYAMKERLQDIWKRSASTHEHLRHALEEWCRHAEATGIEALREFARRLRGYSMVPANH
jgi:stearoyl-CoA desaturase (delta-9 desaturase)